MSDALLILIITHFVSDWLFQPAKWAIEKIKNVNYKIFHCVQYTILFLPVLYFLKINLLWLIWIFLTHFFIEDHRLINWWNKNIKGEKSNILWLTIVEDQILHIISLIPLILKIPFSTL